MVQALIDHVALEIAAELDPLTRYGQLGRKQVLRSLVGPKVPPAFFDRPKSGFELPLDIWIRAGLQGQIDLVFADKSTIDRLGLNSRAVRDLWAAYQGGAPGLYWSRVWAIYVLLEWARQNDVSI